MLNINSKTLHCGTNVSTEIFYIKDIKDSSCELTNESDFHIKVENKEKINITFLKIDKCFFSDSDRFKKCDCAVFSKEKSYFIEIKEVENIEVLDSKLRKPSLKRKNLKKEATKQLIETINQFKKLGLNDLRNTNAIISIVPLTLNNYTSPISTRDQSVIADFMTKTGCPNLFIGNVIEF
ncbi:MAG: hypothetical protein ACK479_12165 [Fluviicola sp.]|jgi:hypothetical protein